MERSRLLSPDDSRRDVVGFLARLAPLGLTLSVALAVALTAGPGSVADAAASPVPEGDAQSPQRRGRSSRHYKTGTVAALAVTSKIAALVCGARATAGTTRSGRPWTGDLTNALPCDEDEARRGAPRRRAARLTPRA